MIYNLSSGPDAYNIPIVIFHKFRQGTDCVALFSGGIRKISWNFGAPCTTEVNDQAIYDVEKHSVSSGTPLSSCT